MKKIIFICLFCFLVSGCKQKASDCTASETRELVKNIVLEQVIDGITHESQMKKLGWAPERIEEAKHDVFNAFMEKGLDLSAITINLDAIRTIEEYENGSCLCKANVTIKGYMPNNGGETSQTIRYTSELTDNGDEFFVTVYDLN